VEQQAPAANPYIALLREKAERKRLIDDIVEFATNKLEDPGQPQGPIFQQALRLVFYELEIDGSTNQDEVQRWQVSLRENPQQYKSIFGFSKGHDGGLRASVGKRSPQYSTRSPFFLTAMGSTCKQGNPQWEPKTGGYHIDIGQKTIQKAKAHPAERDRE